MTWDPEYPMADKLDGYAGDVFLDEVAIEVEVKRREEQSRHGIGFGGSLIPESGVLER